jgi:hypothetical protein
MTNLTQASSVSRLGIKWGVIGLVGLMVGRMVIGGLITWYKNTHPVVLPPTVGFGVIPPITFPENESPKLTYKLETISGTVPELATQADVFLMPSTRPNLLAMDRSIKEANNLGFKGQAEKVSSILYKWKLTSPLPSTLSMYIYDGRFSIETDWTVNPNFLVEKNLPSQTQAIKEAQDMIRKVEGTVKVTDLNPEETQVRYLKGLGGRFQSTTSLSDADFVQVDLYRTPHKDLYPFVTSIPDQGLVRIIFSGNPRSGRIIQVKYNYFPIDYAAIETYPLKTATLAWQELQEGKGFIAQIDKSVSEVVIRQVTLAYYDSFESQAYAQPVFVFTGDNNFVGYVQAVRDPKAEAVSTAK